MATSANNGIIASQTTQVGDKKTKQKTITSLIEAMSPAIKKALPSVITPERFTRMVLTAVRSTPKLADCDADSLLGAMMQSAQLGLEPNTPIGQSYLIPYGRQCQFVIGYKGLIDLAYRSGNVEVVQAHEVRERDTFDCEYGLHPKLKHVPADGDRGDVVKYYAIFMTKDGGYGFEVMSREDIERHARMYSKAYGSGPWQTSFDEMAKKTVLKKVLKYAPIKTECANMIAADGTIKTEIAADMLEVAAVQTDAVAIDGDNAAQVG